MKGKKEKLGTEPYKGVRDFYPEDQSVLDYLLATMKQTVERFGYIEYGASPLEPSELYRAKGAENAELVGEQTYSFVDRGGREVTLRPEMTPTVARMVAGRRRELPFPLRWYSIPNVFRYERPQRGRLREHYQLNVDLFGVDNRLAEVEIISVAHAVMRAFGAEESDFEIRIGSRKALDDLFARHGFSDEQSRAVRGLIDRRDKMTKAAFATELVALAGHAFSLPEGEPRDVAEVREGLRELGIKNTAYDLGIVRGFDYYSGIVFEVYDTSPKNRRSLFGGGRYDDLLSLFSDEKVPGVGFGMGDVTMRDFLETRNRLPEYLSPTLMYIATVDPSCIPYAMKLAEEFRENNVNTAVNLLEKSVGDQLRVAHKLSIPFALVVGPEEMKTGTFRIKTMASGTETTLRRDELGSFFLRR